MTKHFFQIADLPQLHATNLNTPQGMTDAVYQSQLVSASVPVT